MFSILDALSQLLGRLIPVRYDGRWHHYTRTANESISGASSWHAECGRWPWVEKAIDAAAYGITFALTLGRSPQAQHCLKARVADRIRAAELLSIPWTLKERA